MRDTTDRTREIMQKYWSGDYDEDLIAEDVVYTIMATGEEHHGPEAVRNLLQHFYRVAFDATADVKVRLVGDNHAALEATFVGKHIGEFAGIPATGREVEVPLCVIYELRDEQIVAGRIYFELPALMTQLGVT